jgi:ATP-dependent Lhr-like helicase
VQRLGWPRIVAGSHTLMVAPTGSGKTLAAFLAGLDATTRLDPDAPAGVRVLYISPLKALVYDIERNLRAPLIGIRHAARRLGVDIRDVGVDIRTGDTPQKDRARQRRKPRDILVTTPESLYLLLTSSARETLRSVQTVILDEIHVMAGTKRGVHLALSLERLAALCEHEPQRVGLSATVKPPESAASFLAGDRPVDVIDTSEPPRIDLSVIVPIEDMENPPLPLPPEPEEDEPEPFDDPDDPFPGFAATAVPAPINHASTGPTNAMGGIWPSIHPELLALVRAHTSTILFVNSRILCERLTQALNELAGEAIAAAHHGSISHERRAIVEEQLKSGSLPCIVATSSLELGIDMGAVDLVILVASPGTAARGLQRVGRAGHQVGAVSMGRVFPKYRGDLLECAVVTGLMERGEIEAVRPPRNCLDVLAQQVVAMVAMEERTVDQLHAVVRRAAPYAELSADALRAVLDMLSGRYPSDAFAELTPSVVWDRATDVLTPRRGANRLAILNGGTIPDRGLFRVRLGSDGPIVGELDEEMVFESRPGDVVILGASSWRITEITRDIVEVVPAPGEPGRLAFWRGERPGRPIEVGKTIGAFLRELGDRRGPEVETWLAENTRLDTLAARNLAAYLEDQHEAAGVVPTDRVVLMERFRDELGDWRVCLLTPFGSRVHAPWALALEAVLSAEFGGEVQTLWTDDGIAMRFADTEDLPAAQRFLLDPEGLEDLIVEQLRHSAVFAARFREAAGRALLLPRRRGNKRTPLWLQRKKAASLLGTAQQFPDFPIVLEAYRECLQDVFDLPALTELLGQIRRREVRVEEVETRTPSPFARSLVFSYVSNYLYDGDAPMAERRAAALTLDRNLLRELLGQEALRDLLDRDVVDQVELELQCLTPERKARHADALHDMLRRLGDLTEVEIDARTEGDADPWLQLLSDARRVLKVRIAGEPRWVAIEDAARYRDALGVALPPGLPGVFLDEVPDALEGLIARWARTHGPFHDHELASRFGMTAATMSAVLQGLVARDLLVYGELRPGGVRREFCDAEVMRRLRRRTLAHLRKEVEPVEPAVLARFLPAWHGLDDTKGGIVRLLEVVDQLEGIALPWSVLESEVLPARVPDYQPLLLDQLGAMGQVVWIGRGPLGSKDGKVALYRRERIALLVDAPDPEAPAQSELHATLRAHLDERGASFLVELQMVAGKETSSRDLQTALWDLVWDGRITNDTFQPLRQLGKPKRRGSTLAGGRWSSVASLVPFQPPATERALARARVLLERYGVISRQTMTVEPTPGGFSAVYGVLKVLEESGRARRGWFVADFGGAQFALPGAIDRIRGFRETQREARILAAADPAQPWGGLLAWPETVTPEARLRREAGARVVLVGGVPVLYLGRGRKTAHVFRAALDDESLLEAAVRCLAESQGYKSLRLDKVDGHDAHEAPSTPALLRAGIRKEYKGLVLAGRGYL